VMNRMASPLTLPTVKAVNDVRIAKFKEQIAQTLAAGGLEQFRALIEDFEREADVPAVDIAAALAKLSRGDVPLLLEKPDREPKAGAWEERPARADFVERPPRSPRDDGGWDDRPPRPARDPGFKKERVMRAPDEGMATFRIEVGHANGVKPGNIVGAIANEANIDSKMIGRIEIYDDFSTLDLPADLPPDLIDHLKTVWVAGQQLQITRDGETPPPKKAGGKKSFGAERRYGEKPAFKKPPRKA
jgi:ATP-dependent RNA helicase DeaD